MKNIHQVDNNIENFRVLDYLYQSRLLIRKNNAINRSAKSLFKAAALLLRTPDPFFLARNCWLFLQDNKKELL